MPEIFFVSFELFFLTQTIVLIFGTALAWVSFAEMVGLENVNPRAESFSHPALSVTLVTAMFS
jgi:hypothetical protein